MFSEALKAEVVIPFFFLVFPVISSLPLLLKYIYHLRDLKVLEKALV